MKQFYILFLFITSIGFAQIPSGYYDTATGSGYTLKSQLETIIDNINDGNGQAFHNTSVTYSDLWTLYETSDVRTDGKVWDIYSDCNFTFVTDQDTGTGGTTECDVFNREHTFPQSWYGGDSMHPMRADAYHVLPSDKKVNSERGNLAYAEVSTATYTSLNGSKKGTSSITGPTGSVFEPIDEYKGDIARGYFYVAARYQDEIGTWEANDSNGDSMLDGTNDKVFEQWALDTLYDWHLNDPVSQKEIDRNNVIFNHQDNRNPFIDHPEYVLSIWGSVLSTPTFENLSKISIYPNPIKENTVYFKNIHQAQIEIYDVLGKKVLIENVDSVKDYINVSNLNKGIYLV
ncbi:MAG: endonuclease, partial [Bacteroidetes bacterium]|nr:endonuclease [Bacteroidota bacterium]